MRIDPVSPPLATLKLDLALDVLSARLPGDIRVGPPGPIDAVTMTDAARALAASAPSPAVLRLLAALLDRAASGGPELAIEARVATNQGIRTVVVTAHLSGGVVSIELTLRPDPSGTPAASPAFPPVPFDGDLIQLGQRFFLPALVAGHGPDGRPGAIVEQSLLAALAAIQPPARLLRRDRPRRRPSPSGRGDDALATLLRSMGRSPGDEDERAALDRPA